MVRSHQEQNLGDLARQVTVICPAELQRRRTGADPAHVQQRDDGHKIALALRESRIRSAAGEKPKVAKAAAR